MMQLYFCCPATQRDRRVLEKQSRAIMKMPTKQSKEEVAAVEVRLQFCN